MNMNTGMQRIEYERLLSIQSQQPLVVIVPFDDYIDLRERTLLHTEALPPYLLMPEIQALLTATLDDRHRLLFDFLWHTGARISEALSITPKNLMLDQPLSSYASLVSLKRQPKRTNGKAAQVRREVPITDAVFILALQRYIKTHNIKKLSPLFDLSRIAAYKAIQKWAKVAKLPIEITPHTLRHSYAVNHLLHGQQLIDIKGWMGHSTIKSTEIYLQVLGRDTAHLAVRTQYNCSHI